MRVTASNSGGAVCARSRYRASGSKTERAILVCSAMAPINTAAIAA